MTGMDDSPIPEGWGLLAGLSDEADEFSRLSLGMPLLAIADAQMAESWHRPKAVRAFRQLEALGLARSAPMGQLTMFSSRSWLTDAALEGTTSQLARLHSEGGRIYLYSRLPMVESFYAAVCGESRLGSFQEFQWFDGLSFNAAAKFENGWILMFWTGVAESEAALRKRLSWVVDDLRAHALYAAEPLPSFFYFVATDAWQLELARLTCARLGMSERFYGKTMTHQYESGSQEPSRSVGWLMPSVRFRNFSPTFTFEQALRRSPWAIDSVPESLLKGTSKKIPRSMMVGILQVLSQWPGVSSSTLRRFLRNPNGTTFRLALDILAAYGLVEQLDGLGPTAYSLTPGARAAIRSRDGVSNRAFLPTVRSSGARGIRRAHEAGLADHLSYFALGGCPTAVGTRYVELLGSAGRIAPDGLVHLSSSPWGATWAFVEYERYARFAERIIAKLSSYLLPMRRNSWPVLLICSGDAVERRFWAKGSADPNREPLRLLTSTIERATGRSPFDNDQVWSYYGKSVNLPSHRLSA